MLELPKSVLRREFLLFKRNNYNHTVYACFAGYIVQAIVNNFAPLLFLTFQSELGV